MSTASAPTTPKRGGSAASFLGGFAPWIVYWAMLGSVSYRTAVLLAFGVGLLIVLAGAAMHHSPKVLEVGSLAVFVALVIVTFTTSDTFLERWIQPLSNAGLFLIAIGSVLVNRPFTLQYAEEMVSPEDAARPGFLYINKLITWVWVVAFGIMTISSFVPPLVEGEATVREGGSALSILGYWVVPFTFLGLAGIFTSKFPDFFAARLGGLPDDAPAPAQPLPATGPEAKTGTGVRLVVDPPEALADAPLAVRIDGLAAGTEAVIRSEAVDAVGHRWVSEAIFGPNGDGTIDTSRDAPSSGDWSSAGPAAPLTSMRFATEGSVPDIFLPPPAPWVVATTVSVDGTTLAVTAVRRATADGVGIEEVHTDDVVARVFTPASDGPHPGVLLLPGSEGGLDSQSAAAGLLASHGYVAMVAAPWGVDQFGGDIVRIPLERIDAAWRVLLARSDVVGRAALMSISKGAEAALAAASHFESLQPAGMILVSPSAVVWQGLGSEGSVAGASSWTVGGQNLPFVPAHDEELMPEMVRNAFAAARRHKHHEPTLLHLMSAYGTAWQREPTAIRAASLPVEQVGCPLLLVAGDDDQVWPSPSMIDQIRERRSRADVDAADVAVVYPGAGHLLRMGPLPGDVPFTSGIALGGTRDGMAAAQVDFTRQVLDFLGRTLR